VKESRRGVLGMGGSPCGTAQHATKAAGRSTVSRPNAPRIIPHDRRGTTAHSSTPDAAAPTHARNLGPAAALPPSND
jgi:hypothetical protein